MDGSFGSPGVRMMDTDDSCTPFGSQLSTPCSKFNGSSTLQSTPDAPSTAVALPFITTASGVHPNTTVTQTATAVSEKMEVLTGSAHVAHMENMKEDLLADAENGGPNEYIDFLHVEKDDPLLQVHSGWVELLPSYDVGDDVDVALPTQV